MSVLPSLVDSLALKIFSVNSCVTWTWKDSKLRIERALECSLIFQVTVSQQRTHRGAFSSVSSPIEWERKFISSVRVSKSSDRLFTGWNFLSEFMSDMESNCETREPIVQFKWRFHSYGPIELRVSRNSFICDRDRHSSIVADQEWY